VFAAAAIVAELAHADPILIFVLSALGLIPLAKLIGDSTEELAVYTGPKLGGLLNATLGNAAELIIAVFAIQAGLLDLVRASIAGSIIGNLLLVMGLALFAGGLKHGLQQFDRRTASLNATLLILAVVALAIPSLFDTALVDVPRNELLFSEGVGIVLILIYGLNVLYSFTSGRRTAHHEPEAKAGAIREPEPVHEARWSLAFSLVVLIAATVGTALVSEALVGAVEPVSEQIGLSPIFVGLILIPLVGNVAEHLVAVQAAMKNKMELSMAISLGSSIQVALFVAPALVFIALLFGQRLLLVFNNFELLGLMGAAFIAAFIAQDGESNWLEGAMLLAVYLIVALGFLLLPAAAMGPPIHP
jgi:Ca2+:H+ antiporter